MPSTSTRGFIVRPIQDNTEPEAEPELDVQVSSDYYPNVPASEGYVPVYNGILSSSLLHSVEERIKDKMLEKIENYLERNQFHDLSLLVTTYEKFKELHP